MLIKYLSEMRNILDNKIIPMKKKGQKCSGCSLSDICFPRDNKYSVREIVMSQKGVDAE